MCTQLKRIKVFQLKCIRKILNIKTTYIDRNNTNEEVIRQANQKLRELKPNKTFKQFHDLYTNSKTKKGLRILKLEQNNPIRAATFQEQTQAWTYPNRLQGRPKTKWSEEVVGDLWKILNTHLPAALQNIRATRRICSRD